VISEVRGWVASLQMLASRIQASIH
jgi:hypothetical protein